MDSCTIALTCTPKAGVLSRSFSHFLRKMEVSRESCDLVDGSHRHQMCLFTYPLTRGHLQTLLPPQGFAYFFGKPLADFLFILTKWPPHYHQSKYVFDPLRQPMPQSLAFLSFLNTAQEVIESWWNSRHSFLKCNTSALKETTEPPSCENK